MHSLAIVSAFFAMASAHGVVLSVEGANGVTMPGLSSKMSPYVEVYNGFANNRQLLTELLVIAQATDAVLKLTPPSFVIVRSAVEKPALWAGPRVTALLTPPS